MPAFFGVILMRTGLPGAIVVSGMPSACDAMLWTPLDDVKRNVAGTPRVSTIVAGRNCQFDAVIAMIAPSMATFFMTLLLLFADIPSMKSSLEMKVIRGANWFFWVAGLSIINSILSASNATIVFVIGLGITQIGDGIAAQSHSPSIAIAVDVIAVGMFALFGYFARKGMRWAFVVGMLLYAFDGALFVAVRDWFAIAFHVLALYFMYQGLAAANMVKQNEQLMRDMSIRAALQKDAAIRAAAGMEGPAFAGPTTAGPSTAGTNTAGPTTAGSAPMPWRPAPPSPPEETP